MRKLLPLMSQYRETKTTSHTACVTELPDRGLHQLFSCRLY